MKDFSTEYFHLTVDESLQFFIDDVDEELEATTLYFTRGSKVHYMENESMLGSIEIISGSGEEVREMAYLSASRESLLLDGHVSEAELSDQRMNFTSHFEVDGNDFLHSHILYDRGGEFTIYLKFLHGHSDIDMQEMEDIFAKTEFLETSISAPKGSFLPMKFEQDQINFKIGNRRILNYFGELI